MTPEDQIIRYIVSINRIPATLDTHKNWDESLYSQEFWEEEEENGDTMEVKPNEDQDDL